MLTGHACRSNAGGCEGDCIANLRHAQAAGMGSGDMYCVQDMPAHSMLFNAAAERSLIMLRLVRRESAYDPLRGAFEAVYGYINIATCSVTCNTSSLSFALLHVLPRKYGSRA